VLDAELLEVASPLLEFLTVRAAETHVVETDSMLVEPVIGRWRLRKGVRAKRGVAQLEDHVVEAARVFVKCHIMAHSSGSPTVPPHE
jgi:hypothetical protein